MRYALLVDGIDVPSCYYLGLGCIGWIVPQLVKRCEEKKGVFFLKQLYLLPLHMAATYTSAAIVRKAAKWLSADLTDGDIVTYIEAAESLIDETMRKTGRGTPKDFTFNAKQHAVIQRCATAIAGFYSITYQPSAFPLLEEAELTLNLIYFDQLRALTLLGDKRVSDFLAAFSSTINNPTYSSVALVKKGSKYVPSALSNSDIETFIFQGEGLVDAVMLKTARGTTPDFAFSSSKHQLLQRATTGLAAFYCITFDIGEFPLLEQAEMSLNLIYYDTLRALTLLADIRTVDYLSGL